MKFIKLKKNNKKKGFTLIELVAVLAIIAVLSAAFVPKISGYIKEAQKVAVLNEAKNIITSYEAISYKLDSEEETQVSDLKATGMPLEGITIKTIPEGFFISDCREILNNKNYSFEFDNDGKLLDNN